MPLNFEFPESTPKDIIEYHKDGQCFWHPRAESFVYYQMILQHDLTGEMTNDKLIEIARRIALIDLFQTSPHIYEGDERYRLQLADVIAYWGLTTNVSHLTRTKWDAYYHRCFTARRNKDELEATIKRLSVRTPLPKPRDAQRS